MVQLLRPPLNKFRIYWRESEWNGDGGTISNDVPTMIDILFKITNTATSIGVSNLKD